MNPILASGELSGRLCKSHLSQQQMNGLSFKLYSVILEFQD
jgi:hypothetical protein